MCSVTAIHDQTGKLNQNAAFPSWTTPKRERKRQMKHRRKKTKWEKWKQKGKKKKTQTRKEEDQGRQEKDRLLRAHNLRGQSELWIGIESL